ncbi:MAG: tripartite tricarboxylate transporter permease [Firmicutes bacterium]|nr:tripartite tricarboxylate transporter permease [Bacillota bacterium]
MNTILEIIGNLFTLQNLLILNLGLATGIIIGSLPGLTATMGVALLLPLTFGLDSVPGMLLLLGVYCGGIYGGSITGILIKTPGTPSAAATVLDGYPMAEKGEASRALDMALIASVIGGLFSAFVLMFIAPIIAQFALKFGPIEYFAIAVFGLTIISGISGDSVIKGLIMGLLGLLVTTIGLDPVGGIDRFTFDIIQLASGINIIPAMIGLFAIAEIIRKAKTVNMPVDEAIKFQKKKLPFKEVLLYWKTLLRSSMIGTFIGAIPGTGSAIASFISYNEAKRNSKDPSSFGKGNIEGIAASECANNAVTGAALIPLLTLGIPGDPTTAILIGALIMQGIIAGPLLFVEERQWVYSIMIGLVLLNIFMLIQGKLFIKAFANVVKVPTKILLPILIVLCVIGSFAVHNTVFDVLLMLVFGLIGYVLLKLDFPLTPMVIAIVLGPLAENNMRRALIMSQGDFRIFFTKPISAIFLTISILVILVPMIRNILKLRDK